jgi:hypothetical protein
MLMGRKSGIVGRAKRKVIGIVEITSMDIMRFTTTDICNLSSTKTISPTPIFSRSKPHPKKSSIPQSSLKNTHPNNYLTPPAKTHPLPNP